MTDESSFLSKLEKIADAGFQPGVIASTTFIGNVVLPGLGPAVGALVGATFQYRKQRSERNLTTMVQHISDALKNPSRSTNQSWTKLSDERKQQFKDSFFPTTADYVADEKEADKVSFITEGLLQTIEDQNLEERHFNELNDILSRLKKMDLQILYDYQTKTVATTPGRWDVYSAYRKISREEFNYISGKLETLNLLESNRQDELNRIFNDVIKELRSLGQVVQRIAKTSKGGYQGHPIDTKVRVTYHITNLGTQVVKFSGCEKIFQKPEPLFPAAPSHQPKSSPTQQ